MKLLITGDSFASNWYPKYKEKGWPNYLEEKFQVTNLAQAGCSEYKIYKQLRSINLKKFEQTFPTNDCLFKERAEREILIKNSCTISYFLFLLWLTCQIDEEFLKEI